MLLSKTTRDSLAGDLPVTLPPAQFGLIVGWIEALVPFGGGVPAACTSLVSRNAGSVTLSTVTVDSLEQDIGASLTPAQIQAIIAAIEAFLPILLQLFGAGGSPRPTATVVS